MQATPEHRRGVTTLQAARWRRQPSGRQGVAPPTRRCSSSRRSTGAPSLGDMGGRSDHFRPRTRRSGYRRPRFAFRRPTPTHRPTEPTIFRSRRKNTENPPKNRSRRGPNPGDGGHLSHRRQQTADSSRGIRGSDPAARCIPIAPRRENLDDETGYRGRDRRIDDAPDSCVRARSSDRIAIPVTSTAVGASLLPTGRTTSE